MVIILGYFFLFFHKNYVVATTDVLWRAGVNYLRIISRYFSLTIPLFNI